MEEKRNPLTRFIEDKLVPVSTGFAQNAYVRCIGSGSQSLMAVIMIGAIFNLFNSIAWEPYQNLITSLGISSFLTVVYNASMNFMGIFMVFSVAFNGAKIWNHQELSFNNGLLALMSYLILIPYGADEAGNSIVMMDYLGSHGVFLAFIVGILVTKINIAIVEKKITIKMPEGVPENVTQSFVALASCTLSGLHIWRTIWRQQRRERPFLISGT